MQINLIELLNAMNSCASYDGIEINSSITALDRSIEVAQVTLHWSFYFYLYFIQRTRDHGYLI